MNNKEENFQEIFDRSQPYGTWCNEVKAKVLFETILTLENPTIVEIGVFMGQSAFVMMETMKRYNVGGNFVAVDPWTKDAALEGSNADANAEWWSALNYEDIYNKFLECVEENGFTDFCRVVKAPSSDARRDFPHGVEIDVLHIDGNHSEEKSTEDVSLWLPLVKKGGYIIMDDTNWSSTQKAQTLLEESCSLVEEEYGFKVYKNVPPTSEKSLTLAYITSKEEPLFERFVKTLIPQLAEYPDLEIDILFVDLELDYRAHRREDLAKIVNGAFSYRHISPKPNPWQGKYRRTKADYFCAANARNTAFIYAKGTHIACVDDTTALSADWLKHTVDAVKGNYIVLGAYRKIYDGTVTISESGILDQNKTPHPLEESDGQSGLDSRLSHGKSGQLVKVDGACFFGCSFCVPMEAVLKVNGFDEIYDGLGGEDYDFGLRLSRAGYELNYCVDMLTFESGLHHRDFYTNVAVRRMKVCSNGEWADWNLQNRLLFREPHRHRTVAQWTNIKECRRCLEAELEMNEDYSKLTTDWIDEEPLSNMSHHPMHDSSATLKPSGGQPLKKDIPILFLPIPKAAGSVIAEAIAASPNPSRYSISPETSLADIRQSLKEKFTSTFKFACVRNPYDRFVSAFFDIPESQRNITFENFVNESLYEETLGASFKSQYDALADPSITNFLPKLNLDGDVPLPSGNILPADVLIYPKRFLTDYVIKYETLDADWGILCRQYLDIPHEPLSPSNNPEGHPAAEDILTPTLKDKVYNYYEKDFTYFEYQK